MTLAFKKVRVIFCLISIYGTSHGWSMECEDDQHRVSPVSLSSDDDSSDGFHKITEQDAKTLSTQAAAATVVANPAQNHWFWNATIGRLTQQQKQPPPQYQSVLKVTGSLSQLPASQLLGGEQVADINAITPLISPEDENGYEGDDDGEESGTESEKSPHEDLNEKAVDSVQSDSISPPAISDPVKVLPFEKIQKESSDFESDKDEESDGGEIEENEITGAATAADSSNNDAADVTARTKTHSAGIITVQPGAEQTAVQTTVVQNLTDGETLTVKKNESPAAVPVVNFTTSAMTLGQEGEGSPFFTQATVVALGLSAIIILPHLLSRLSRT